MDTKPEADTGHVELAPNSGTNLTNISPGAERQMVQKIDFILVPLAIITLGLQYIDKTILSGVSQFGIIQDLQLFEIKGVDPSTSKPIISLQRFSAVTLIFYWGFLAGTIPAAILAQKLPVGKFLSCTVIVWGLLTVLTIKVHSYAALLVLRFFLGVAEAGVGPGFGVYITMFWTRQQQPLRYSIWYAATGLGGLLGPMIMYGMVHVDGPLPRWHYPYIILGSVTIAWGIVLFIWLPNNPETTWFLNKQQRLLAVERIRTEQTGIEDKTFRWYQAMELVTDPKSYLILAMNFCLHYVNGAISGFGTIIITAFGFSQFNAVLLTGAVGAMVFVTLILAGIAGSYIKNSRLIIFTLCEIPVIIGASLMWKISWHTHRNIGIAGFILLGPFAASYAMLLALVGANTAGHTKKVLMQAIIWSSYAICNGISPLFVRQTEVKAQYPSAFKGAIITAAIAVACGVMMRFYLQYQNYRRDKTYGKQTEEDIQNARFLDQTDMENKTFRYVL